jgi:hypothetical protein
MSEDYIYDVFISYRRQPPVLDWVRNHFHPLVEQWLPNSLPPDWQVRVFIDEKSIETGSAWPEHLKQALRGSRCLLPIWSPDYFRSAWCVAEWQSMREREKILGYRTNQNPTGLIYPVRFADGDFYPTEAKLTQQKDFRSWNTPHPIFRETRGFVDFDQAVQVVCGEIAAMLQKAPPWSDQWPVVTPAVSAEVKLVLPRLK